MQEGNKNNVMTPEVQLEEEIIPKVDTSNLTVGMIVKNYKEMCSLLGDETKGGDSKKAQLGDWQCYFDWEKSGQKFIITDIYDNPLTKEDKRRFGNNSIYVQCIEVILLQYLSKQEGFTKTLSKRNWWEMLGLINPKYGNTPVEELKQLDNSVTPWEVKHFYQRCDKKMEQILFSSLSSLRGRKLIEYEMQTIIIQKDEFGNDCFFSATDEQKKRILEVERYVLHTLMGYERMFFVFLYSKQKEFYEKTNRILKNTYGWEHYYKQIKIIYTPDGVKEALPELEAQLQRAVLNDKVVSYLNKNASENYQNQLKKYEEKEKELMGQYWGSPSYKELDKLWTPPDTYVTAQHILTNALVKLGHSNRTFSTEQFIESNTDSVFAYDR